MDFTSTLPVPAIADIRYDDAQGLLLISTDASVFEAWNPFSGAQSFSQMSVYMSGFDTTPDGGRALIAIEGSGTYASESVQVALPYMNSQSIDFAPVVSISPEYLVFTAAGFGVASGRFSGSETPYKFALDGGTIRNLGHVGVPREAGPTEVFETPLLVSQHRRYVLIEQYPTYATAPVDQTPASPPPSSLELYDSETDRVIATNFAAFPTTRDHKLNELSTGDISEDGHLVAVVKDGLVRVFDFDLKPVRNLNAPAGEYQSAHFNAGGHQLFAWDAASNQIHVYDTQSWSEVAVIDLGAPGADLSQIHNTYGDIGEMSESADGRMLFMIDFLGPQQPGVRAVDLSARLHLSLQGDATHTQLFGAAGADTLVGGAENDVIGGGAGADSIVGGAGYNRVNGNTGDDTIVGHSRTGDWLLGGQGQDSIDASASTGANLLNGNLGDDTLIGGAGPDTLRGGQGDDAIRAGPGADWISGDLGTNTIYAGQGSDTFHAGAGRDIIEGWRPGDHVQVDAGVTWRITQVNADVQVTFSNGGEMDLIGVQQGSLQTGWVVG